MTLQTHRPRFELLREGSASGSATIMWEPQLGQTQFRRRVQQATIMEVSANGALIRAGINDDMAWGVRVSIGRGDLRGLVAVRDIELVDDGTEAEYAVQFLWLDPALQAFFDGAVTTDAPFEFGWR
jgi:hypothetical protein